MTLRVLITALLALVLAPIAAPTNADEVFKKLPDYVIVGTHTYAVHMVRDLRDDKTKQKLDGACHFLELKDAKPDPKSAYHFIEIEKKLSQDDKESTLIHEILHAVAHENGFPLPEAKVRQLEAGLYQVFKTNGWKIDR